MKKNSLDDILSYREMCTVENNSLQRGMYYQHNLPYSILLMSRRPNAPYQDSIHADGITIEYEGHDVPKNYCDNPKLVDQVTSYPSGKITQNGYFAHAAEEYKEGQRLPRSVKVYEKILTGVWSLKGMFDLVDYAVVNDGKRNVFKFYLRLSENQDQPSSAERIELSHTRLIPSQVKLEVWKRDGGKCVTCGETKNLHFDHDLPYSKGGTSLTAFNVRLLCMKHNLKKSDKIE